MEQVVEKAVTAEKPHGGSKPVIKFRYCQHLQPTRLMAQLRGPDAKERRASHGNIGRKSLATGASRTKPSQLKAGTSSHPIVT